MQRNHLNEYYQENQENIDLVNVNYGQQRNDNGQDNEINHLSPDLAVCGIKITGAPRAPMKSLYKRKRLDVDLSKVRKKLRLSWDAPEESQKADFRHSLAANVQCTLKCMDPLQAFYAESIINQVLKCGSLNLLSPNTGICNNECDMREYQVSHADFLSKKCIHSSITFGESQGLVEHGRNARRNVNNNHNPIANINT